MESPVANEQAAGAARAGRPVSRRAMLRASCAGAAALALGGGGWARLVEPYRVEYHHRPMALPGLPSTLEGLRLAHLTDLHVGPIVPLDYLQGVMAEVNRLRPDLVVVTGDVIHHNPQAVEPAGRLLGELRAPVVVSFGNHDYGHPNPLRGLALAHRLEGALTAAGCTVLRNRLLPWEYRGAVLQLAGLDDLWAERFDPDAAFAAVNPALPLIALSHNPDSAPLLAARRRRPDWILAGHTHGGQVRFPLIGATYLPIRHREFVQGEFQLGESRLYVSRGVGFSHPIRFNCAPEVVLFTLTRG